MDTTGNTYNLLKKITIFNNLQDEKLRIIFKKFKKKKYPANQIILTMNDAGKEMFIILSGSVSVFHQFGKRKRTLDVLKNGDVFGEISVLTSMPRTASVETLEEVEILSINKKDLLDLIKGNYELSLNIIKNLSDKLINANQQIDWLTFKNVQGILANQLYLLSTKYGEKISNGVRINIKTPHKFLAELAGVSRETATRIINQFKSEKSIEIREKFIVITDSEKLLAWS